MRDLEENLIVEGKAVAESLYSQQYDQYAKGPELEKIISKQT